MRFDRERFPDPKGMVDSIHDMHGRVMISVWPKFYVTTEHYKEFDKNGWMYKLPVQDSIKDWVGPGYLGSFYDAYSADARKLFWNQMKDHYVPLGIDAWSRWTPQSPISATAPTSSIAKTSSPRPHSAPRQNISTPTAS